MKILLFGLGSIGQRHLRNLVRRFGNDLEVIAFRKTRRKLVFTDDLKVEDDSSVEEKYNIKSYYDISKALREKPFAAFICTPTRFHVKNAIDAANAGCHLFIEKPLSDSMENIEELKAICEKNNLTVYVGFQLRFNPVIKLLKEKIKAGAIGDLLSVHAEIGEYLPGWHKYEDYRKMYASKKELGGGVVLTQIHEFDYLYWLFGMPEKVFALGGKLSGLDIDVEDTADVLLQMNFMKRTLPVSVHMDYIQRPPARTCKVIGTKGKIIMDLVKTSLTVINSEGSKEEYDFSDYKRNQMYSDELDHFFNCIKNKSQPVVNLNDAINSLKICLAVKQSLEKKEIIKLDNYNEE
ncbi:Gfo/Idh/MocA family oxidoreductase [Candidatus Woesearchaeota archaeon]|nr:Gfo/Idh/MocA family oxidoreductase [Candidatus Woesearchaeota archaeon]